MCIEDILVHYIRLFSDTVGLDFILMVYNAHPNRAHQVNEFLVSEDTHLMDWPARTPDINAIKHVWDDLGRTNGIRFSSLRTMQFMETVLLEK